MAVDKHKTIYPWPNYSHVRNAHFIQRMANREVGDAIARLSQLGPSPVVRRKRTLRERVAIRLQCWRWRARAVIEILSGTWDGADMPWDRD